MAGLMYHFRSCLKGAALAALLVFCAPSPGSAAVMEFPTGAMPSTSGVGLDQPSNGSLRELDINRRVDAGTDLLPNVESRPGGDDIVDSVLGVSQSGNWLEETRDAERAEPANALDLMKAYVNVLNNSAGSAARAGKAEGGGQSDGIGRGFLTTLAQGLDDTETLSLISQVMQPHIENDLVSFSVLGFGQFMVIGEPDSGNLSVMNLASGKQLDLRSSSSEQYGERSSDGPRTSGDAATFMPNEEETLAQLLLLLLAVVTNPLFILTAACIFSIWLVYRLAKRLS